VIQGGQKNNERTRGREKNDEENGGVERIFGYFFYFETTDPTFEAQTSNDE